MEIAAGALAYNYRNKVSWDNSYVCQLCTSREVVRVLILGMPGHSNMGIDHFTVVYIIIQWPGLWMAAKYVYRPHYKLF